MFEKARAYLAQKLAPTKEQAPKSTRSYAGANFTRLTSDWVAGSTSVDSEVLGSLRTLRNRSRQLVRDNDYARNAMRLIRNNIIGQGIGFQSQVVMARGGKLDDAANDLIETAWKRWCRPDTCSVSGKYSFNDIERLIGTAIPESGEIIIRIIKQPFGSGKIPFALEIIEADQLVDNYTLARADNGNQIKMGVEFDKWNRPVAYHMYPYHPGDYSFAGTPAVNKFIRIPANEIIHLGISDRPGQTRFVPWMVSALRSLNDMAGYEEAEIVAARASACIMGVVESPEDSGSFGSTTPPDGGTGGAGNTGQLQTELSAGEIMKLFPGEKFNGFTPSRPNSAMEPFVRYLLRKMAAGVGVSYESLSRDYSQSNYSSSRLALLDDRDNWRALQAWLIEQFHQRIYEQWLEMAVMSGQLNLPMYSTTPERYQAVRWMPRGWSWIDPLKEVMAAKLAVRSGFITQTDVIAGQGGDIEDQLKQRRRELDLAADYGLVFETDPSQTNDKGDVQANTAPQEADTGEAAAVADDTGTNGEKKLQTLYRALNFAIDRGDDLRSDSLIEKIDALEKLQEKIAA